MTTRATRITEDTMCKVTRDTVNSPAHTQALMKIKDSIEFRTNRGHMSIALTLWHKGILKL